MREQRETEFAAGYEGFIPAADDNPDSVPFYRVYAGVRLALGVNEFDAAVHDAACWASHESDAAAAYRRFLAQLRDRVERQTPPSPPTPWYGCEAEPELPTEDDAFAIFRGEFKRRWPEKRINSTFAKEKWSEVADAARAIAAERYQTRLAAYRAREAESEAYNVRRRAEWLVVVEGMARLEDWVRGL